MTISSENRVAGPYIGNDAATAFPFAFKVFGASDLQVVLTDADGAESTLTLTTDYTVTLNSNQDSNPGGTVTLPDVLATGTKLTITSNIDPLQATDLTNQGGFYPKVITNALDKLTILIQQIFNGLNRSIKLPISNSDDGTLPAGDRAYTVVGFDALGKLKLLALQTGTSLVDLAASAGAWLIGFIQSGSGAVKRTVEGKLREWVSVKDFGAVGDGVTDDTAAIQAALDYVGANGGGTVFLPMVGTTGRYRTTSVLRIPNYTLEGTNPLVFPFSFNNGLVADFATPMQWVIEAKTTSVGNYIPYNDVLTAFPDGATYNCGIRNLRIGAVNTTPFGGVRMQGYYGPIIENVSIAEVGCGFLLNESLGGRWVINSRAVYYGMALRNDCNANEIRLYATQSPPATNVHGCVPASVYDGAKRSACANVQTRVKRSLPMEHWTYCWCKFRP